MTSAFPDPDRLRQIAHGDGKEPTIGEARMMALEFLTAETGAAAIAHDSAPCICQPPCAPPLALTEYELDGLVGLVRDVQGGWVKDHQREGLRALARHLEARKR